MPTWLLFAIPAAIWSTTFYAITLQLPHAPAAVSLVYRFGLATLCMFAVAKQRRELAPLPRNVHAWMCALGLLQYTCSYSFTYNAERFAPSGLASLAFTLLVFLNPIGAYLLFKRQLAARTIAGAALGFMGIVVIFAAPLDAGAQLKWAMGLLLAATLCSFAGNMISLHLSAGNVPAAGFTAWGLLYGTIGLFAYAVLSGAAWTLPSAGSYWASLVYLGVFGTAVAFGLYTTLLQRIGPIAGYMAVVTPVGALALSYMLERMVITPRMRVGAGFAAVGAVLALYKPRPRPAPID